MRFPIEPHRASERESERERKLSLSRASERERTTERPAPDPFTLPCVHAEGWRKQWQSLLRLGSLFNTFTLLAQTETVSVEAWLAV